MKQGLVMVAAGFAVLVPVAARAQPTITREVSRSSPIVATIDSVEAQYQGSYEVVTPAPPVTTYNGAADDATFRFPQTAGHLRAVDTDDLGSTSTALAALELIEIFDAADGIPFDQTAEASGGLCAAPFTPTCRTVFTTVDAPASDGLAARPTSVLFDTNNLVALQPLLAPTLTPGEATTLIQRVRAGGQPDGFGVRRPVLGGIDRLTLAIADAQSPFIPLIAGELRPTAIYVGGLDGMVHAICAEVRGSCGALGQELWAFIPRTQLGRLRFNTQRIDGSVKVADVFDDYNLADGQVLREWRTVLTVQTGSGDPGIADQQPSVVAIDVSNPAEPSVLWERSTPSAPAAVDQGVGLSLAMGAVRVINQPRNFTFVQTNNGGTSTSAGFYLAAIDTASGQEAWRFTHLYDAPRTVGNPAVPDTGIPGGAAAFDIDQSGVVTHVAVSSLYGDIWVMESDGDRPYGNRPIFRFSGDFQPIGAPPTIYFDQSTGRMHALAVSGSYVDPVAATWVQTTSDHFAVSVVVDPALVNVPMDEVDTSFGEDRAFVLALSPTNLTTAQAIVSGNELFVAADSTDVNLATYGSTPGSTGTLTRYSLSGGGQKGTAITIAGGASSTSVTGAGMVHVGSGGGAMKVDVGTTGGGGAFDDVGRALERKEEDNNTRLLWLIG